MDLDNETFPPSQWSKIVAQVDNKYAKTEHEFSRIADKKVLVACSGGPDSIALAVLAKSFEIEFGLAYIDHGINIATSECEIIVKELAQICGVPFYTAHLNLGLNPKFESNIEATARSHRYEALEKIRITHKYEIVATAHHLDDVAETYLINLIRGSGSGISSLAKERNSIVRPILHWRKRDLEKLNRKIGLNYFIDEMNSQTRFVRNRIRNEVIPLLNDISDRDISPLIERAARFARRDNEFLDALASSKWPGEHASTRVLSELDPVLQVHAIRAWINGYPPSEEEMERILEVVKHDRTSTQISGNRTIWRSGAILYQDITPDSNWKH